VTAEATDALVDAIEGSNGLPIPTPLGYAMRIEEQLKQRGYEIVRTRTARGDLKITGYPCTCKSGHGCLEHPFRPVPEINP
jgi:hypothetical protein